MLNFIIRKDYFWEKRTLSYHSDRGKYQAIPFKDICRELGIPNTQDMAARLIAHTEDNSRIPTCIKLGLDVGREDRQMPCNICTNLQPFNPSLENKPSSFRWAPLLADRPHASVWIMNSSPHVTYTRQAEIELTFFREKDTSTIKRSIVLSSSWFSRHPCRAGQRIDKFF